MVLGRLLKREPLSLAGVDIGTSAIHWVELGQDRHGVWIVERCVCQTLEPQWMMDGSIMRHEEIASVLRQLSVREGGRTKHVAMALPYSAVMTKMVALPGHLSEEEMEIQVEVEARQYMPFSLDEVCLDFCITGPNVQRPEDVDVLLVIARRERIQERLMLAAQAGLTLTILDVDVHVVRLVLERLVATSPGMAHPLIALVQAGVTGVHTQFIQADQVLYDSSEQDVGGAQCHLVQGMVQAVARALQLFVSSTPFHGVEHIMLFGSCANLDGLAAALQSHTGVETRVLNPFDGMVMAADIQAAQLQQGAASYLTACGLAMRRFLQ